MSTNKPAYTYPHDGKTEVQPFASADEIMELFFDLICAHGDRFTASNRPPGIRLRPAVDDDGLNAECLREELHRRYAASSDTIEMVRRFRQAGLNRLELELALALIAARLGLVSVYRPTPPELIEMLRLSRSDHLKALRAFHSLAPLIAEGIVGYEDPDEELVSRNLEIDPALLNEILDHRHSLETVWDVDSQEGFFDRLRSLNAMLRKRSDEIDTLQIEGQSSSTDLYRYNRRIQRLQQQAFKTIQQHPDWPVSEMCFKIMKACGHKSAGSPELLIIWLLLGNELQHYGEYQLMSRGDSLARAVIDNPEQFHASIRTLLPDRGLVSKGFIQPCGGNADLLSGRGEESARTEFELGDSVLDYLGLSRRTQDSQSSGARQPRLSREQLVLPERTSRLIDMAIAGVTCSEMLMNQWGLGSVIPYGNATVLLFSGPPGTGKTATAEAVASALDTTILVVNYADLLNCYVGNTEKNIARSFRVAVSSGAVLFFDEVDTVLRNRDSHGSNSFLDSFTNAMLTQLECFKGVVVLATNRADKLDPALQRRVSHHVPFEMPQQSARRAIFEKLIPDNMPLADNVDLDILSEAPLSGGDIKNVVLNAARYAVGRKAGKGSTTVTQDDFMLSISNVLEGKKNTATVTPDVRSKTGIL